MNRRVIVAIAVIATLVVGSVVALAVFAPRTPPTAQPVRPVATSAAPDDADVTLEPQPGEYVDYSIEAVPAEHGRTFVFFYAPWCGQCRQIDAGILAAGVPDDVTIFKADFDSEQELEQQYGVTMRTTFIELDADAQEIQRFVAFDTPTFDAVLAAMAF